MTSASIMETSPIVRRKDEETYDGDCRTKRVILEIYEAMQESIRSGQPYQTRLDPQPADPRCCHPPRQTASVGDASSLASSHSVQKKNHGPVT